MGQEEKERLIFSFHFINYDVLTSFSIDDCKITVK